MPTNADADPPRKADSPHETAAGASTGSPGGLHRRLWRIVDYTALLMAALAALSLLALLLTIALTTIARAAFDQPLSEVDTLMQMMLVMIVSGSIAFGARHGAHVHLDLLGLLASDQALRPVDLFSRLLGTLVVGALAWALWVQSGCQSDCTEFAGITIAHAPFYRVLAIGIACYAAMLFAELLSLASPDRHA